MNSLSFRMSAIRLCSLATAVLFVQQTAQAFRAVAPRGSPRIRSSSASSIVRMISMDYISIGSFQSFSKVAKVLTPLCIEATSKSTTINDPTAGMTPEEIQNYMSNVGGSMCGYPEVVRTSVGTGLNVSLLLLGILTLGYALSAVANYVLEKQVEDTIRSSIKESKADNKDELVALAEKAGISMQPGLFEGLTGAGGPKPSPSAKAGNIIANADGGNGRKLNREDRRLQKKMKAMSKKPEGESSGAAGSGVGGGGMAKQSTTTTTVTAAATKSENGDEGSEKS